MGITERKIRQKEEVRSRILESAWDFVKQDGWEKLSIRRIAEAIEYSVPVIYDHFENKDAILLEFGKQGFCKLVARLQKAKAKSDDPSEQLKAMADAYWSFSFQNKEYYQLMFGLGIAGCDSNKCIPGTSVFQELVMQPIEQILTDNHNDAQACLKYHTFWSIMHGLVSIKMMSNSTDTDTLNKLVLDDAIDGFIRNLKK